jgi:hypothetical protein
VLPVTLVIPTRLETLLRKLLAHTTQRGADGDPTNEADNNARKACELLLKHMEGGQHADEDDDASVTWRNAAEPRDAVLAPKARLRIQKARFLKKYELNEYTFEEEDLGSETCVKCDEQAVAGDTILRHRDGRLPGTDDYGWTHCRCAEFWVGWHSAPMPPQDNDFSSSDDDDIPF